MPSTTPNYDLPYLAESQDAAEVVVNDSLNILDQVAQPVIQSRVVSAEPGSPVNGQAWIVASGASGTHWTGQDGKLAIYDAGWYFVNIQAGFHCFNVASGNWEGWTGSVWKTFTTV